MMGARATEAARRAKLLASVDDQEPIALAQQLIRIPSFLWQESEIGHWLADWMRRRGYEVSLQTVPLPAGGATHQAIGRLPGAGGNCCDWASSSTRSKYRSAPLRIE